MLRYTRLACFTLLATGLAAPTMARAICRVVEPSTDSGRQGVAFDPTTMALYALSPDQVIGYDCEVGEPIDTDGVWTCEDGAAATPIRDTLLSLVVQPQILATGGDAGLVMPVPARPDVFTGPPTLIEAAAGLVDPMIEETVYVTEDPSLGAQCSDPHYSSAMDVLAAAPLGLYGCGSSDYYRPGTEDRETTVIDYGDAGTVRTETLDTTEGYDVTVVSAETLDALLAWMDEREFAHADADDEAFAHYVGEGAWFVAVHVHPDASGARQALAPIVVTWRGDRFPITHRLQYDPRGGMVITHAFVIAPHRMGSSDLSAFTEYAAPATFLDTELAGFGLDEGWLTELSMTRLQNQWIQDDAWLEEVPDEEELPTVTRTTRARIAAPCCPGGSLTTAPGAFRTYEHTRSFRASESPAIPADWLGSTPSPGPAYCGGETFGIAETDELRGCSVAGRTITGLIGGWGPLALVIAFLVWRHRRYP